MAKVNPSSDDKSETSGKHSSFNLEGITGKDGELLLRGRSLQEVHYYMVFCDGNVNGKVLYNPIV